MTNITNKAMLVNLKFSMWTPRKQDKQASIELNAYKKAQGVTVNKSLVTSDLIKAVVTAKGAMYTYHAASTLPWLDAGWRALAGTLFEEYTSNMNTLQATFNSCVQDVIDDWHNILATGQATAGDLYNADDYPTVDEIANAYACSYDFQPIVSGDDFRCDISEAQATIIKADITKQLTNAANIAQAEVFTRIATCAGHMASSLEKFQPKSKTQKQKNGFHDTLVTNVSDLVNILPDLNLQNDSKLTQITEELKTLIEHSATDLKSDPEKRQNTAAKAKAISNAMQDLI